MNKPFDQRVINHLERPTSSDLNIAQSQINAGPRALMRQLLQPNPIVTGTGSLGESFFVEKTTGDRSFKIKRGVGFNLVEYDAGLDLNIGSPGITGLSDPFDYRMVTLQSNEGVPLTVPAGPGAGLCRRDVVAIRCSHPSTNQLEDYTDTDIYDPLLNKFNAESKPKTFSYDLTGSVPQVLNYNEVGSATAAVVYVTGQVVAYTGPDTFLSAPAPLVSPGYINIAIIQVVEALPTVAQSDVVDFRRLVAPHGNLVVKGSATIGSLGGSPGARLQSVVLKTPPGIKAQLWKVAEGTSNSYALAVYGPRNVTAASLTLQRGDSAALYSSLKTNSLTLADRPLLLVSGPQEINGGVNEAAKTLAASSSASPTQQVAIGQPYHVFPFTLCRVDNVTSTVSNPVTITGTVDIAPIPNSPADAWPAGTYSVNGHTNYRTFYLQAGTAPTAPVAGLSSPTWLLADTLNNTAEQIIEVNDIGETYQRVVGFVADVQNMTWQTGIWKLSLSAIGLPFSGVGTGVAPISAIAQVYLYDGVNNPESGTLIASSQETLLPNNFAYANQPEYVDFFIDEIGGGTLTTRRLYIVILVKKTTSVYSGYARFYFNYQNNRAAFLETNILAPAPTVTIPNKADRWPAGVDLAGSFSADPFNLEINVAGSEQRLNPAATTFAVSGATAYSEVPINFTLNLTVE